MGIQSLGKCATAVVYDGLLYVTLKIDYPKTMCTRVVPHYSHYITNQFYANYFCIFLVARK